MFQLVFIINADAFSLFSDDTFHDLVQLLLRLALAQLDGILHQMINHLGHLVPIVVLRLVILFRLTLLLFRIGRLLS